MDVSLVAFVFGLVNLALLGLLADAWRRDRRFHRVELALRVAELGSQIEDALRELGVMRRALKARADGSDAEKKVDEARQAGARLTDLASCVDAQADEIETLKRRVEAFEGGTLLEMESLRRKLDSLCEELDAVERACGPKEGDGTMNVTQSQSGWKTALQSWKALLGLLKGLLAPLVRVLQRGK